MSSSGATAAANEIPAVEICKGINGLDKVVLRDVRGSSVEVLYRLQIFTFFFEVVFLVSLASLRRRLLIETGNGLISTQYRLICASLSNVRIDCLDVCGLLSLVFFRACTMSVMDNNVTWQGFRS